ncbi:hypothetical protein Q5752_003790 [Cryptotrichosporon argae]
MARVLLARADATSTSTSTTTDERCEPTYVLPLLLGASFPVMLRGRTTSLAQAELIPAALTLSLGGNAWLWWTRRKARRERKRLRAEAGAEVRAEDAAAAGSKR